MLHLDTARLVLRPLTEADAAFILALLNDPAFLRFIGDRGVRTPEDARGYSAKLRLHAWTADGPTPSPDRGPDAHRRPGDEAAGAGSTCAGDTSR
jgi:hypothetical protein